VKTNVIAQIENLILQWGQSVRTISVQTNDGLVRLLDRRSKADKAIWIWWGVGLTSTVLTVVGIVGLFWSSLQAELKTIEQMEVQLRSMRAEAIRLRKISEEYEAQQSGFNVLQMELELEGGRMDQLAILTNLFPDSAWVSDLNISGSAARITGLAASDATQLIDVLNGSSFFEAAEFSSPVAIDRRTGQRRFEITAQIVLPESQP